MTVVFYPSGKRTSWVPHEGVLVITDCYKKISDTVWRLDLDKVEKFWANNPAGKYVSVFGVESPVCACCGNSEDICACGAVLKDLALSVEELIALWEAGSDIPISEDECIETEWAGFPIGTPREDVWHWFDDLFYRHGTSLGAYLDEKTEKA